MQVFGLKIKSLHTIGISVAKSKIISSPITFISVINVKYRRKLLRIPCGNRLAFEEKKLPNLQLDIKINVTLS